MKEIYVMRHSEPLKCSNIENNDSLQLQDEKHPLTENGELLAKEKSKLEELQNFDVVISSNYVRAISTAKYFTKEKIHVIESFGERKFGFDSWEEKPKDFEKKQFEDFNYKYRNGESLNEVMDREINALNTILDNYHDKKILIVGHATALTVLFSKWCNVNWGDYRYNDIKFFDGNWNFCETFKLKFDDDNELIDITNIR